MEEKKSKTGMLIGLVILLAAIVGIVALTQQDPAPLQDVDNVALLEGDLVDGAYTVEPEASKIVWAGQKSLILNWSHTGEVEVDSGSLTVTDGMLEAGEIVIDMTNINVTADGEAAMKDDAKLISHLQSDDFFDVATYPTATFVVTDVAPTDEMNTFQITGDMTIKENTREISFPAMAATDDQGQLMVVANMTIDRTDYDVRFGSGKFFDDLGDNVIDDEFSLNIALVASPESSN
jgi:polyisoprenoid-binding protein YceI